MPPWNLRPGAGKTEDPSTLQEERPLLRIQQREAREIDLARIDLGLAEVRVDGAGELQAGRDVVENVEPWLAVEVIRSGAAEMQPAPRDERADVEADALRACAGPRRKPKSLLSPGWRHERCAGRSIRAIG
jgi:hypothetical protein